MKRILATTLLLLLCGCHNTITTDDYKACAVACHIQGGLSSVEIWNGMDVYCNCENKTQIRVPESLRQPAPCPAR